MSFDINAILNRAKSLQNEKEQSEDRTKRPPVTPEITHVNLSNIDQIVAKSLEAKQEIVQEVNDLCKCGHGPEAHLTEGEEEAEEATGPCVDCECLSYFPKSQDYDLRVAVPAIESTEAKPIADKGWRVPISFVSNESPQLPFVIPAKHVTDEAIASNMADGHGEKSPMVSMDDNLDPKKCWHLCAHSGCQRWWSHGDKDKCRFPDIMNQGLCPNCLNGEQNTFGEDFEEDEKGGIRLLPARIVQVKNATRRTCHEMTIEQLTQHMLFNVKRIAELQAENMETRKMRSEREEEALLNIPEEEREKFRQALRQGAAKGAKKGRAPKEKKETPKMKEAAILADLQKDGVPLQQAKLIAGMMIKTGKTRAQVEAWLND